MAKRARRSSSAKSVKLKPADPFELIRWLARSQSDPRKAVAELVQNSLDAGARTILIERVRLRGEVSLRVLDDGEGVLPELDREQALRHIATHIGHSHKLGLSPSERRDQVVAGKYGVGLLGFWCIGQTMELRTRVAGSKLWALRMEEDSSRAEIDRASLRTDSAPTLTEVIISPIHAASRKPLGGRRLADYLAAELRGQLLRGNATVTVFDRTARGIAQKRFEVVAKRFTGERLSLPEQIAVPGFEPITVELYQSRGSERAVIQVACAGTLVADDLVELGVMGLEGHPWRGAEVLGMLDFPSFSIPPGTRRGVTPDAAAMAFLGALTTLQPLLADELERLDDKRQAVADRSVARELRRALRGLSTRLPQYALPIVEAAKGSADAGPAGEPQAPHPVDDDDDGSPRPALNNLSLFPPGPLASVTIAPTPIEVAAGAQRRLRTRCADRDAHLLTGLSHTWTLRGPRTLALQSEESARPAVTADTEARSGETALLVVVVTDGDTTVSAEAQVTIVAAVDNPASGAEGVPEPVLVSHPDARWRSRMVQERWEVNEAHEDYRLVHEDGPLRLRYLLGLLAKEIVIKTSGRSDIDEPLESVIEVLAHAERNLRRTK